MPERPAFTILSDYSSKRVTMALTAPETCRQVTLPSSTGHSTMARISPVTRPAVNQHVA